MPPVSSRIVRFGSALATLAAPLAMLVTRLVLGWAFLQAGWGKWHNLEKTSEFFASLKIAVSLAFVGTFVA